MEKIRLLLLLLPLSLFASEYTEFEKLHLLAVDEVYVQGVTQYEVSNEAKEYDCSIDEREEDWNAKVKSSKKRYFYVGVPDDPSKDFNCAFDNEEEALLAKAKLMHNCISSGSVTCHIGGTGDSRATEKNKNGSLATWIMSVSSSLAKTELLLKRDQLLVLQKKLDPFKLTCMSFGHSDKTAIAECVERLYLENLKKNNQANVSPNNRSGNLNDVLIAIGNDIKRNPAFNPNYSQSRICNFKNIAGAIIQGDCRNSSIKLGYELYWRQ